MKDIHCAVAGAALVLILGTNGLLHAANGQSSMNRQTTSMVNSQSNVNVNGNSTFITTTITHNGVKTVTGSATRTNTTNGPTYETTFEDYIVEEFSEIQRDCNGNGACQAPAGFTVEHVGLHKASALNNQGEVAGTVGATAGTWKAGQTTDLGMLGCSATVSFCWSAAYGLNESGQVVGETHVPSPYGAPYVSYWSVYYAHEALWDKGEASVLKTIGWEWGRLLDVNNKGTVVGYSRSVDWASASGDYLKHGFIIKDGEVQEIGYYGQTSNAKAVNAFDNVTGDVMEQGSTRAFLWDGSQLMVLGHLGGNMTYGNDINNVEDGHVVGTSLSSVGYLHGFLRIPGIMYDLGTLPGYLASHASALNDRGQIVGASFSNSIRRRAVLWQDGSIYDLNSLIPSDAGIVLVDAIDVNDRGQILVKSNRSKYYLLTPRNN